jgi:hypothetical protein
MPTVRIVTATTVPASGICSDQTMVAKAKLASPRGPNYATKALLAIGSPVPARERMTGITRIIVKLRTA